MPSKNDCITAAFQRINVVAIDETATTAQLALGDLILNSLYDEVSCTDDMNLSFWPTSDPDSVPYQVFMPFSWLLATDIAPMIPRPSEPRHRAWMRLAKFAFPDDRFCPPPVQICVQPGVRPSDDYPIITTSFDSGSATFDAQILQQYMNGTLTRPSIVTQFDYADPDNIVAEIVAALDLTEVEDDCNCPVPDPAPDCEISRRVYY